MGKKFSERLKEYKEICKAADLPIRDSAPLAVAVTMLDDLEERISKIENETTRI